MNLDMKSLKSMLGKNIQMYIMFIAIIVIMAFFSYTTEGSYLTPRNISNLLRQTAITGILAIGMVFVIISAEIDLSVGSMMGLLGGLAAIMDVWLGLPLPVTVLITLAAGTLLGTWNGWWVAYRKVPSFIVTLAGLLAFRGILVGVTSGQTVAPTTPMMSVIGQSYLADSVSWTLGVIGLIIYVGWHKRLRTIRAENNIENPEMSTTLFKWALIAMVTMLAIWLLSDYRGVPTPVLILTVLCIIGIFIARNTTFGRRIYAIGGNIDATQLSGINVKKSKMLVFTMNGFMVAVAGLILCSRLGAGSPSAGNIAELDAIASCVIGGASLAGGVGTVFGAVIGAFIMASLDNGMSMMDVPTFWQYIVKGTILLLAVWMDSATKAKR